MKKALTIKWPIYIGTGFLLLFGTVSCQKTTPDQQASSSAEPTQTAAIEPASADTADRTELPMPEAAAYFQEIDAILQEDNGALWGKNLKAPFLFVNDETSEVTANEADMDGFLTKSGDVYTGSFPEDSIVANSVTTLGNKEFAMVIWDEYPDETARDTLFIHELFHYHQPVLGLNKPDGMELLNSQLNERNGRIYLRLEWAALNDAINSTGSQQMEAIQDALAFRQHRLESYACRDAENEMMIREGTAEYTGIMLSADSKEERIRQINENYELYLASESFVRSFAYYSGPAYGFLLDEINPNWKLELTYNSDLGELLAQSHHIDLSKTDAEKQKSKYGYDQIAQEETQRKDTLDRQLAQYEKLLIDGPTVTIQLSEPSIGFNPMYLVPYKDLGTIYPQITITDIFGRLELTEGGCLLSEDWKTAVIPAGGLTIDKQTISGNGWYIELD